MLARLDRVPGVAESRTDASGRYFLLVLDASADERGVLEGANAALRGRAVLLDDEAARAQLAALPTGDPWFSLAEVRVLSYVEARIVAFATAARIGARVGLLAGERDALAEAIRVEVFAAIERVHAEGGRDSTAWFYEAWPALAADAAARVAPALAEERRGPCSDALRRAFIERV